MKIIYPTPEVGRLGLRAMRMVAEADGKIAPAAQALMEAARHVFLKLEIPLDDLEPIEPAELAEGFSDPALAEQLCQGMIIVSFADGPASDAAWERIAAFADAMGVKMPALRTIRLMMEHHMLLFRLDFLRHSHIAGVFKDQYRHHGGIRGLAEAVLGLQESWHCGLRTALEHRQGQRKGQQPERQLRRRGTVGHGKPAGVDAGGKGRDAEIGHRAEIGDGLHRRQQHAGRNRRARHRQGHLEKGLKRRVAQRAGGVKSARALAQKGGARQQDQRRPGVEPRP